MNDEFLHRLRKHPRPAFAARLRARLERQSVSPPPPRVPSRARTLLILLLLLLGGTAFAITALAMRGLPPSLVILYQDALAWISAQRTTTPEHRVANEGFGAASRWGTSGSSSPHRAALRGGGTTQSGAPATNARSAATSSAGATGGGAPSGPQAAQISVLASWSAYAYATVIAASVNRTRGAAGAVLAPQIDVSLRDSDLWPGPMCRGGAGAPDMAYTFQAAGTVSDHPCPADASGNGSSVIALPLAYETLVLARSPLYGALDLTRRQVFLALAKWVPDQARSGRVHENASTTWRQIDAALGPESIEIMGPPLSSAAGRSMIELLVEAGCNTYPWIAALASTDPTRYARICRTVRTDGAYTEVSDLAPSTLLTEPNAVGILTVNWVFTFPNLDQLRPNGLAVSRLDGVEPTPQGILSGTYPGSRGFYLYVNRGRVARNVVARLVNAVLPYGDWALVPVPLSQLRAAYAEVLGP